ncbi:hypothetical protein KL86DES1_21363 [uncultured Desulfovibrio sp.]|uniref:Uncharacterized protein n=1 Tax=uncultured Desulfovibrio sp. TaxID=167968 RepID=A0A212L7U3_9BACT|nr:hypothetical protein KL86DES1_21363 [uncultured Desulfovibrio sp.]VZH34261.1 conserved protein of unknown function [Desulfovibrio sp. 86]
MRSLIFIKIKEHKGKNRDSRGVSADYTASRKPKILNVVSVNIGRTGFVFCDLVELAHKACVNR